MKYPYYKILGFLGLFGVCSCSDLLDKAPLDQLTDDTFYQTESDADRAVLAAYSPMADVEWVGKGWMITEIPSDNSQPGGTDPDFTPIDNFTVTADNLPVANFWAFHYRQVTLANVVIDKVEEMTISEIKKNEFIAEAKFLRAIAYFDLVRVFGGVPLITSAPAFDQDLLYPRAIESEVYDLVKEDFAFAAEHLPVQRIGSGLGRATKGAALAFLAKVQLNTREYVAARDNAKAVMDLGVYDLMDDFSDNFELSTSDNNKESIFQVQFTGCGPFGTGNALQAFFAPWGEGITKDRDGWGSQIPTAPVKNNPNTTILDAITKEDARRHTTLMLPNAYYPTINPGDGGYTYPGGGASAVNANIKKYVVGSGPDICFMSTPQNYHMMRFAEVLLIYAEAVMVIQGGVASDPLALEAFNRVRTRAQLEPVDQFDLDMLLNERRAELAFEGDRWFDLVRTGKAIETLTLHGKNIDAHNLKFPIPSAEIEINPKLEQ
ncbi:MAG: RagB/SusD family nutrient uptake outer membrane protein, partial [Bacteroidota bacterium]